MHLRLSATLTHWTSIEMLRSSQHMNATRGLNTIQTKRYIQTWRKKTRIKQQSYLTRATTLLPVYNLPCSREKIATVAPQPLHKTAYQPTLCPHLIVKSASTAYTAHTLNSLAAETIDTYSNTMTHVYTDVSAMNAVEQAGYIWSNHTIPRCNAARHWCGVLTAL